MKLGTYSNLSLQLLGFALLWSSAACGNRSPLVQEENAGVVTEDEGAQRSNTSSGGSGGRASSTTPRAGRGGAAGAAQALAGRGARAGRGGNTERGGSGGVAAGSGDDKRDEPKAGAGGEQGGSGGEQAGSGGERAGSGGEQAGAGGEQAGTGGEMSGAAGMPAAGSGGAPVEQAGMGAAPAPAPGSLTQLTPQQITELCATIDMNTAGFPWGDGIRGYCSRRGLAQPQMCSTIRDMCVDGPEITPVCAQTVPDCPMISITEFERCRIDTLYRFVEDNRMITCDTMPPLPEPSALPSCDIIYDRCPAARALRVL